MGILKQLPPQARPCHECGTEYAGSHCPRCKTEHPTFAAMKRITANAHHGVAPLRDPQACRYFPESICGCNGRGECLSAA